MAPAAGRPPPTFSGVIQDTASTATLVALLCARERTTGHGQARGGLQAESAPLVVYASEMAHSSIEKAALLAGFGRDNLRLLPTDEAHALLPDALEEALRSDVAAGRRPCAIVATVGSTGTTAIDPVARIGELARAHGAWLHVDAALAGTAMSCPELRWMWEGVEQADSVVWNPHKWLGIGFDCTAYHVRDPDHLVRVMATDPSYLRTAQDGAVKNYRDWGIALGRRFRALKVWFVLSALGVEGIRAEVRQHLALAAVLRQHRRRHARLGTAGAGSAADRRLPPSPPRPRGQGARRAQPGARPRHQRLGTGLPHPRRGEGRPAPPRLGGCDGHHRRRRRRALEPAGRDRRRARPPLTLRRPTLDSGRCPGDDASGRPVLVAALSFALAVTAPLASEPDPAALEALLASVRGQSFQGRLLGLSERFLGTPYAHSPLGEGEGPDPDPRLRLDRVDCLTYVETVMALALSSSVEDVVHVLDSIRYRNRPDYAGQKPPHGGRVASLQRRQGAGPRRHRAARRGGGAPGLEGDRPRGLDLHHRAGAGAARPRRAPPVASRSHSSRWRRLPRAPRSWPSGTLLLVVREDAPWRITRVSHLGFVVQRGGRTYLRHATRGWKDGVVDEELSHLLARHARYSWKIVGVSLWEVRDPRPRSEAVSATSP